MTRTPNRWVTVGHTLWNARSGSRPVRSPGAKYDRGVADDRNRRWRHLCGDFVIRDVTDHSFRHAFAGVTLVNESDREWCFGVLDGPWICRRCLVDEDVAEPFA